MASLDLQTVRPSRVRIWHNGPEFPAPTIPGAEVLECGANVGFGEGINRLLERVERDHAIIANPDLVLDKRCVEALRDELYDHPSTAVVAAVLVTPSPDVRVNAYGLRLTSDYLGICPDRGQPWSTFQAKASNEVEEAMTRYLGP